MWLFSLGNFVLGWIKLIVSDAVQNTVFSIVIFNALYTSIHNRSVNKSYSQSASLFLRKVLKKEFARGLCRTIKSAFV